MMSNQIPALSSLSSPPLLSSTLNNDNGIIMNSSVMYLPETFVPSENEIIIGRGKRVYHHPGNVKLRDVLVQPQIRAYAAAKNRAEKTCIITEIYNAIRCQSAVGFIKCNTRTKQYYRVEDTVAKTYIAQQFRDLLGITNGNYKSSKQYKQKLRDEEKNNCSTSTTSSTCTTNERLRSEEENNIRAKSVHQNLKPSPCSGATTEARSTTVSSKPASSTPLMTKKGENDSSRMTYSNVMLQNHRASMIPHNSFTKNGDGDDVDGLFSRCSPLERSLSDTIADGTEQERCTHVLNLLEAATDLLEQDYDDDDDGSKGPMKDTSLQEVPWPSLQAHRGKEETRGGGQLLHHESDSSIASLFASVDSIFYQHMDLASNPFEPTPINNDKDASTHTTTAKRRQEGNGQYGITDSSSSMDIAITNNDIRSNEIVISEPKQEGSSSSSSSSWFSFEPLPVDSSSYFMSRAKAA